MARLRSAVRRARRARDADGACHLQGAVPGAPRSPPL